VGKLRLVGATLDSTAGGRPNFHTNQWGLVVAASAEGAGEARAALEELYRLYCYPVYAFIRRRGHGRQDAQDLTQDFFVHLLEKGTLARADPRRGRFRSFLLGALDYFLAHAAERARAGKRGGSCQWVFLDDEAAENSYQLAAPEGMTAEKIFDARWAAALFEATFARLRGELRSEGKGHLFEALQGFLLGREDASYQQVADTLSLSLGGLKTVIHRLRGRFQALLREEVARMVTKPAEIDEELRYLRAVAEGLRLQPWRPSQMSASADTPQLTCPMCGAPLQRGGHLAGQCLVCLLELALEEEEVRTATPERFDHYEVLMRENGTLI
jgi:DNA-directed RNA polymerase specialized sigma24 family protein